MSDVRLETPAPGIQLIRLYRPDAKNAMTPSMLDAAIAAVAEAAAQQMNLIVAGSGHVLSAGFDLKLVASDPDAMTQLLDRLSALVAALKRHPRPVVVAAAGVAIAGACALIGGADVSIADRDAKLGYPVVRLGLSPAVSAPFLTRQVAYGAARRLLLDPELITGARACEIGLITECVATAAEVEPRAIEIATQMASKPPGAIAATRTWLDEINAAHAGDLDEAAVRGVGVSRQTGQSHESRSLVAAATRRS